MNKNSLNGILYALFLAIILAANPANAAQKDIFSAIYTYEIEEADLRPIYIEKSESTSNDWLIIHMSKAQTEKISELTKANEGRFIVATVNNHLAFKLTLMDHISSEPFIIILGDGISDVLRSKIENANHLRFFIVEAHFTLPSDMMLPAAQPSFDLALKDDMRTTLCESPHIFLFEDDVLIA
ncbi:MAG: hypothetical protein AB8B77_07775, partial [Alphaproteobacteria bacterium]